MPEENTSLEDLEQLLAQRLEEVQRLQKEIEQKKAYAQLNELTALRKQLEEQLREVNDKIAQIRQDAGTAIGTRSSPASTSTESESVPAKPDVAETLTELKSVPVSVPPSTITIEPTTLEDARNVSTTKMILDVLRKSHEALSTKEIRKRILKAGYVPKSKDFPALVRRALFCQKRKQVIVCEDGKYRLQTAKKLAKLKKQPGWKQDTVPEVTPVPASQPRPEPQPGEIVTNSLNMNFAWIPPGTFLMGSPAEERDRNNNETQHRVTITKGFFLGIYPVTQEQWQAMMGTNPSHFTGQNLPVEQVSWEDCQEFIRKLQERDQRMYRLPTESEWEYACRAGTTTAYSFGNHKFKLGRYAWYRGNSGNRTHAVGQKKPNGWGLFDMHGNVFEWCQDWYGIYPEEDQVDPQGPTSGSERVFRGGSWFSGPQYCRSAVRAWNDPGNRLSRLGFRLAGAWDDR